MNYQDAHQSRLLLLLFPQVINISFIESFSRGARLNNFQMEKPVFGRREFIFLRRQLIRVEQDCFSMEKSKFGIKLDNVL